MAPQQKVNTRTDVNRRSVSQKSKREDKKSINGPFKKVQWRNDKYSHKKKLEVFEERRRRYALQKYYKDLKKSGHVPNSKTKPVDEETITKERGPNPHQLAKQELERRAQEKEQQRLEIERQKGERKEALAKYNKEKLRKNIIMKKKNKKGQPVLGAHIGLLFEKIKKNVGGS